MTLSPRDMRTAFRVLERRLAARRFAALNGRMRLLLLLAAGYVAAFAFWQARVPIDGIHRLHGPVAASLTLAGVLGALALAGALTAAWRRASFAERPPGPEWLALPLPAAAAAAHLDRDAELAALAGFVPGAAVLAATPDLVGAWRWCALAVAYPLVSLVLARVATRIAAIATRATGAARALPAPARELLPASRRTPPRAFAAPRWRRESAWRAVMRLDGLAMWRRSAARTRMVIALLCFAAALAAWFAPAPPLTRRALSYVAFAVGATTLGAWAIARKCADPPAVFRPLPIGIRDLWLARAVRMGAILAAVSLLDALLAFPLPPLARVGLVLTFLPSGFAIAALGLQYALTLPAQRTVAENLYFGWLVVAMVASWMIPFLGWVVLLAGLVHSGLRLARAPRMEVA